MKMNKTNPKVSVCVVTYNQEKYIRDCLQSIIDQETDFDFEVIVGDDCSTDGTRDVVLEFANKYPGKVIPLLHAKNLGPTQNYLSVHNQARGAFVAHLDGDDCCLPGKLQRLTSHMDHNPGCAIVWHRMLIINERGQSAVGMHLVPIRNFIKSDKLSARDLAKYYGITGCHSGSMYRAAVKKITSLDVEALDYFFTLSFCVDGSYASYIDAPLGVYRFFSNEKTVTKSPGNLITGMAKLSLMEHYLTTNPELAKSFAAQCLFELLKRTYLQYPLKREYFSMLLRCRALPSFRDVFLVVKIFLANRNTKLRLAFDHNTANVQA
jgi:glycosyltransferase involved in cell wall biosynthesis